MSNRSVAPNGTLPGPVGERSPKGAPDQAGNEITDHAVVPLADLFQRLHSTETGMKAADAAAVLETAGPNQIAAVEHASLAADFLGRFSNPLVLILLFAAAVSAFTGDVPSFVIIATIVLMSVILDVAQERQAQNAADRLRQQVSLSATARFLRPVLRGEIFDGPPEIDGRHRRAHDVFGDGAHVVERIGRFDEDRHLLELVGDGAADAAAAGDDGEGPVLVLREERRLNEIRSHCCWL